MKYWHLWQNWTCKQKIGHCELILSQMFFFQFNNSEYQGPNNSPYKISAKNTKWPWRKNDFIGFSILSYGGHLDSPRLAEFYHSEALQSGNAACETLNSGAVASENKPFKWT